MIYSTFIAIVIALILGLDDGEIILLHTADFYQIGIQEIDGNWSLKGYLDKMDVYKALILLAPSMGIKQY
jgi:hypothetical protein